MPVKLLFEGAGTPLDAVAENISETGVLIRSPVAQPVGALARLDFGEFDARGEVIWSEESEGSHLLGMRLVSMGWDGWRTIRSFFETEDDAAKGE